MDPPGTQLSHVSSASKFVEVLDLFCNLEVPDKYLKATEVTMTLHARCYKYRPHVLGIPGPATCVHATAMLSDSVLHLAATTSRQF